MTSERASTGESDAEAPVMLARAPGRLVTLRTEIGVLEHEWPRRRAFATAGLANALALTRDIAVRWSTERTGAPIEYVLAAPELALELGIAQSERETVSRTTQLEIRRESAANARPADEHAARGERLVWLEPSTPAARTALPLAAPVPRVRRTADTTRVADTGGRAGGRSATEAPAARAVPLQRERVTQVVAAQHVERVFHHSETRTLRELLLETRANGVAAGAATRPETSPGRTPTVAEPPFNIEALTSQVLGAVERRWLAMRERQGRF